MSDIMDTGADEETPTYVKEDCTWIVDHIYMQNFKNDDSTEASDAERNANQEHEHLTKVAEADPLEVGEHVKHYGNEDTYFGKQSEENIHSNTESLSILEKDANSCLSDESQTNDSSSTDDSSGSRETSHFVSQDLRKPATRSMSMRNSQSPFACLSKYDFNSINQRRASLVDKYCYWQPSGRPWYPKNLNNHSPVNVSKLVLQSMRKMRKAWCSLRDIKSYLASNCDVDVPALDMDIKDYISFAVSEGIILKEKGKYRIPDATTRRRIAREKAGLSKDKVKAHHSIKPTRWRKRKRIAYIYKSCKKQHKKRTKIQSK